MSANSHYVRPAHVWASRETLEHIVKVSEAQWELAGLNTASALVTPFSYAMLQRVLFPNAVKRWGYLWVRDEIKTKVEEHPFVFTLSSGW